jgi:hypothetical protein
MYKSGEKLLILVAVCSLFIFAGSSYIFAREGEHAGSGAGMSEPVIERGNEGLSRQVIEDDAIRHRYYRNEDVPIVDDPQDDDSNSNDSDNHNDDDDKVSDQ